MNIVTQERIEDQRLRATSSLDTSALAAELRLVRPAIRKMFGVSDEAIIVLEIVIIALRRLLDDSDNRPWEERLAGLEDRFPQVTDESVGQLLSAMAAIDNDQAARWIKRITDKQGRVFFRRLLGSAMYDRIENAAKIDGAVVVIALRRGFRTLLPIATALDNSCIFLTPDAIESTAGLSLVEHSVLALGFKIDTIFDAMIGFGLPLENVPVRESEISALVDMSIVAREFAEVISDSSRAELAEVDEALARKLRGADDALEHSEDGVSQAANSLVELIDRLLRTSFDDHFVMGWIEKNYSEESDVIYVEKASGRTKPTKRAQALCFAHAGLQVEAPSGFHLLSATGLAATRSKLQKLKHADVGSAEERAEVALAIAAIEGFFSFALRASWHKESSDRLLSLKSKF